MRQERLAAGAAGGRSGRQLAAGAGDAGVPTKETNNQPMPVRLGLEALRRKRQRLHVADASLRVHDGTVEEHRGAGHVGPIGRCCCGGGHVALLFLPPIPTQASLWHGPTAWPWL